jgi:hypothetical protein
MFGAMLTMQPLPQAIYVLPMEWQWMWTPYHQRWQWMRVPPAILIRLRQPMWMVSGQPLVLTVWPWRV